MKKSEDGLEAYIGICLLFVSLYTGFIMLYQLIVYFLIAYIAKKYLDSKVKPYTETIAVQASVVVIIFISLFQMYFVTKFTFITNIFGLAANFFTIIGLIWLIKKPSLNPIIMLSVFQSILIVVALVEMLNMDVGSLFHKAFANSIIWRLVGLLLMWLAYSSQQKLIHSNFSLKQDDQPTP